MRVVAPIVGALSVNVAACHAPPMSLATDPARASMERNLRLLPWWWVLRWVWFGEAIWVIYLIRERGLTIGQVLAFEAVYGAIAVAGEVPTGVFADRFGRRSSLFIGSLTTSAAFLVFGLADTIPLLVGSYALFAVGEVFMTGADNAFLFDTLQRLGRGAEFAGRVGRLNALSTAAIAAFTVAGGAMVAWTPLTFPILLSAVATIPAALLVLTLAEPKREGERLAFLATGSSAARRVLRTRSMWAVMLLMAAATIAISTMALTLQPVVVGYGVPLWSLGLFVGSHMALAAVGGWTAESLGRRLGLRPTLHGMAVLAAVALFGGASGLVWLFPLFLLPSLAWNVMHPHIADFLSRRAPDGERATVLSIDSFTSRVAGIPAVLLLAPIVDHVGMGAGLGVAALALLALVGVASLAWARSGDTTLEPAARLREDAE